MGVLNTTLRPEETTMSDATRKILKAEAISSLEGYLKSGLQGLLQKGLDRVRALDVRPEGCLNSGAEGIRHLINHLQMYC
jgi:hypothetical protein